MIYLISFVFSDKFVVFAKEDCKIADRERNLSDCYKNIFEPFWTNGKKGYVYGKTKSKNKIKIQYKHFLQKSSSPKIVIVHGLAESKTKYMELSYDLYKQGLSVFTYDARGHGKSDYAHDKSANLVHVESFETYVSDLDAYINEISDPDEKLILFGHSMGGSVVIAYSQKYPNKVKSIILSAPMIKIDFGMNPRFFVKALTSLLVLTGNSESFALGEERDFSLENYTFENSSYTSSVPRFEILKKIVIENNFALKGVSWGWLNSALENEKILREKNIERIKQIPIYLAQAKKEYTVSNSAQHHFCLELHTNCSLDVYEGKHEIYFGTDKVRTQFLSNIKKFLFQD